MVSGIRLKQLVEKYNLSYLEILVGNTRIYHDYLDKIFELLVFLEGYRVNDVMANTVPFVSLEVLRQKDDLKEFLKLNYKDFLKGLEEHRGDIPDLFYEQFIYCSKTDGIETLIILLQKDALSIHSKQIIKGD